MSGLWSTGKGEIKFYVKDGEEDHQPSISSGVAPLKVDTANDKYGELGRPSSRNYKGIFFLPQRPYMVLGTLRQQLLYPTWADDAVSTSESTKPTGMYFKSFWHIFKSIYDLDFWEHFSPNFIYRACFCC